MNACRRRACMASEQVFELARPAGFEPATRCLEGSCSVRLSYGRSKRNCARRRSRDGYTKVAVCRPLMPCHRKTASRQSRGLPSRRGYLTLPSGVELLQADQLDQRIACGAIGQLRVEARPAVTSESRLLRVVPLDGEQVAGFEPATRCLEGSCSVRLSYGRSKRNCARRRSRDGYTKVAVCRPLTPCHLGKRQAASPEDSPMAEGTSPMSSGVEFLQADQLNQRIACGAIGQLRVEVRPAVTSESRLLRVVPFTASRSRARRSRSRWLVPMTLSHLASSLSRRGRHGREPCPGSRSPPPAGTGPHGTAEAAN